MMSDKLSFYLQFGLKNVGNVQTDEAAGPRRIIRPLGQSWMP